MEVNKDEALRCCQIARKLLSEGNVERAEKFVQKSMKLFPTDEARALAQRVQVEMSNQAKQGASTNGHGPSAPSSSSSATSTPSAKASTPRSTPAAAAAAASSAQPETKAYTQEQVLRVKEILRKKCLYERLSVTKDASKAVIKKSYYKLALEFHPDKNTAPGADDAFKAISKAFDILNDDQKRRQYDVTGEDEPAVQQHHGHQYAEMSPEEMFARFFGGGDAFAFPQRRRGQQYEQQHFHFRRGHREGAAAGNQDSDSFQLLQIFFALILILVMTSSFLQPNREPLYSLKSTGAYRIERELSDYPFIKFYVKDTFAGDTRDRSVLAEVYRDVEQHFFNNVLQGCARANHNPDNKDCELLKEYRSAKASKRGQPQRTSSRG